MRNREKLVRDTAAILGFHQSKVKEVVASVFKRTREEMQNKDGLKRSVYIRKVGYFMHDDTDQLIYAAKKAGKLKNNKDKLTEEEEPLEF